MTETRHYHGGRLHDHPGGNVSHDHGSDAADLGKVFLILIIVVAVAVLGYFALRWAATEYYITTHCQDVLGTRVCR